MALSSCRYILGQFSGRDVVEARLQVFGYDPARYVYSNRQQYRSDRVIKLCVFAHAFKPGSDVFGKSADLIEIFKFHG